MSLWCFIVFNIFINMNVGIYKITSPTNKIYIGQSVNIKNRKNNYVKIHKNSIGIKIYNSLKKYGFDAHNFEIIQECPINELNQWETHWKIYYLAQNNGDWSKMLFCELHDSGGGPKSKETKLKISQSNKGKKHTKEWILNHINKMLNNKYALGNKFTIEQKQKITNAKTNHICYLNKERNIKISNKNKGLGLGLKKSKETRIKMSNHRKKSIYQYDLNGNFIKEWNSAKDVKYELNIDDGCICNVCKDNGKAKTAGGFKWKYKEIK